LPDQVDVVLMARYFVHLEVDYPDGGVSFNLNNASARLFYVAAPRDEDGADDGMDVLEVQLKRSLPRKYVDVIRMVAEGQVPPGSDETNRSLINRRKMAKADGRLRFPMPFSALPETIREQSTSLRDEIQEQAQRLARALRWRLGSAGSHQTLARDGSPKWSLDGLGWHDLPIGGTPLRFGATIFPRVDEAVAAQIESIAGSDQGEPVAHAILREAQDNLARNPRSSLVLAVVAIEVGMKSFISRVAPAAAWLANEVPTPPVVKMMTHYLPELGPPATRRLRRPPKSVVHVVEEAIAARNVVAHRGARPWEGERQRELLKIVRAYLYALDFASGADWALTLLSPDEQAAWLISSAIGPDAPGTLRVDS
jgi:hypothetical protein